MKRLFTKACVLTLTAFCCIATSCGDPGVAENQPTVRIQLIDTPGKNDITVQFIADANVARYSYGIGTEADMTTFLEGTLPGMIDIPGNKNESHTFPGLDPDTKYVVFAVAYDSAGNRGPVATLKLGTYTDTFDVSTYYVGDNSAAFRITNSFDYYKYTYYLGTKDDKEAFLNNELNDIMMKNEVFDWVENYFDLKPDTEYVFYAKGWNRADEETRLFEIPIKTAELGSDKIPNVTIEIGDTDFFIQNYTITPNAKCKQIGFFQQMKGAQDGIIFGSNNWQGRMLEMLDVWKDFPEGVLYNTSFGHASDATLHAIGKTPDFELNAQLDIYVLIYNSAYEPFCVKKISNTTPALNPNAAIPKAKDFTITLDKVDIATQYVECSINYSGNDTRAFFYDIVDKGWLDREMAQPGFDKYTLHYKMLENKYGVGWSYRNNEVKKSGITEPELKPNTTYYLGVCPMNENGPIAGGWGEMVLKEFSTGSL